MVLKYLENIFLDLEPIGLTFRPTHRKDKLKSYAVGLPVEL